MEGLSEDESEVVVCVSVALKLEVLASNKINAMVEKLVHISISHFDGRQPN
jgi:hypothetical protein